MRWKYRGEKGKEWKTHFAILPVPIGEYPALHLGAEIVWLEQVERREKRNFFGHIGYEYRTKEPQC